MFHREEECPVFDIHEQYSAPQGFGQRLPQKSEALPFVQFRVDGVGQKMGKNRFDLFHILIITSLTAVLAVGFSGCGHKAPPYYPKEKEASR